MTEKKEPVEKPEPIDNTQLVSEFRAAGGRIVHIHTRNNHTGRRAMTAAFVARSGRIELATSVTHRNDTFTKKLGTKVAIESFLAGRTINVPLRKSGEAINQIKDMFSPVLWAASPRRRTI